MEWSTGSVPSLAGQCTVKSRCHRKTGRYRSWYRFVESAQLNDYPFKRPERPEWVASQVLAEAFRWDTAGSFCLLLTVVTERTRCLVRTLPSYTHRLCFNSTSVVTTQSGSGLSGYRRTRFTVGGSMTNVCVCRALDVDTATVYVPGGADDTSNGMIIFDLASYAS